uniref:Uncharacterized protein n=1 Tax=Arundo donax TaxID=35708 RepID=A0A0A9EJX1_ARUDO
MFFSFYGYCFVTTHYLQFFMLTINCLLQSTYFSWHVFFLLILCLLLSWVPLVTGSQFDSPYQSRTVLR